MKPAFSVRGRSDVFIGPAAESLPDVLPAGRVVAVSDAAVAELHGRLLAPYETLLVGRGEEHKTLRTVETLCRRLIGLGADRKTFILGVGGGIVTDVAGIAASLYMRGLPIEFVSTTLLGCVDASVGGKNGVNLRTDTLYHIKDFICCCACRKRTEVSLLDDYALGDRIGKRDADLDQVCACFFELQNIILCFFNVRVSGCQKRNECFAV